MDIKYMYQVRAEEIADKEFGRDFYDLDKENQLRIYNEAEVQINDELVCRAEYWCERAKAP